MWPASEKITGVGEAAADGPFDAARQRVWIAQVVLSFVLKERADVPPGGKADAEDVGVPGGVDHLVQLGRIEAIVQANLNWQARHRLRRVKRAAPTEFPVAARDSVFT